MIPWLRRKIRRGLVEIRYLLGDDKPAREYLEQFRKSATRLPVSGQLGELRGHGSQTVVVDFDVMDYEGGVWGNGALVLKFEIYPGEIPRQRLSEEYKNECLARIYLDEYMPPTIRFIGHGLQNLSSAITLQKRIEGKMLRDVPWRNLKNNEKLNRELIQFCDAVLAMSKETGQIPDIAGTLPRIDHLSNIFWYSRNIVIETKTDKVWLVDTGWKKGEESLVSGRLRSRLRTWFRLQTLRLFRWRLIRNLDN